MINGQHWAPCRFGTRWEGKVVEFEVKIESGGASWGVHMVANGLIFCLDVATRSLAAVEGLSNTDGIFPPIPRGVPPGSSIRAIDQSDLSEEPDSLIKEPNFKIIYNFLIKDKGQNLIK